MKYLLTILALVILSSTITLYYLLPKDSPKTDPARQSSEGSSYHQSHEHDRLVTSTTRQALVREAQRLGIDKEDSFRRALKEYYEQSLVKVLTDRKLADIKVSVSEEDIDNYLSRFNQIVTFTRFPIEDGKVIEGGGFQSTVLFDELSSTLRLLLANLAPGEKAKQFETGTEISVIQLDKIEPAKIQKKTEVDRERVREQLENYQRSLEIDRWIHSLQKQHKMMNEQ